MTIQADRFTEETQLKLVVLQLCLSAPSLWEPAGSRDLASACEGVYRWIIGAPGGPPSL